MESVLLITILLAISHPAAAAPIEEAEILNDSLEGLIQACLSDLQSDVLPQWDMLQLIDGQLEQLILDADAQLPSWAMLDLLVKAMSAVEHNAAELGVGYSEDELSLMDRIAYLAEELAKRTGGPEEEDGLGEVEEGANAADESAAAEEEDELAVLVDEVAQEEATGEGAVDIGLLLNIQQVLATEENDGDADDIPTSQLDQLENVLAADTDSGESYVVAEIQAEIDQINEDTEEALDGTADLNSLIQSVEEDTQTPNSPDLEELDELEEELTQVDLGLIPLPGSETLNELGLVVQMDSATYRDDGEPEPEVLSQIDDLVTDIESQLEELEDGASVGGAPSSEEDAISALVNEAQEYTLGGETLSSSELDAIDDELETLVGEGGATGDDEQAPSLGDIEALEQMAEFETMEIVAEGLEHVEADEVEELTDIDTLADAYAGMLVAQQVDSMPLVEQTLAAE